MSERKREQLVGKQDPYMSLRMSPDPITLGSGEFALGTNLRSDNGIPTVRWGIDRVNNVDDANFSGKQLLGEWFGYLGGAYRKIVAIEVSTTTRLYALNSDGTTATEITAASGQFGPTRFNQVYNDNEPTGQIQFTFVSDQLNNTNKLIATNGVDPPRVIYHTGAAWVCAIHNEIAIPERNQKRGIFLDGTSYLDVKATASIVAYTDTEPTPHAGTGVVGSNDSARFHPASATQGNSCKFAIATTCVSGDKSSVEFTNALDISNSRQIWVGIDTSMVGWIESFKVRLHDVTSSDTLTLWDPSDQNSYPQPVGVPLDDTNKTLWLFNLPRRYDTGEEAYDSIEFTYMPSYSPTIAENFWMFLCAAGGTEPGETLYAHTFYGSVAQNESPGVVFDSYKTVRLDQIGAPSCNGMCIPNRAEVKFSAEFDVLLPNASVIATGVDTLRIYSMLRGQNDFYLTRSITHATWGGAAWSVTTDNVVQGVAINNATTPTYTSQKLINIPDEFHKPLPDNAMGACFASGRLYTAAPTDGTYAVDRWDTLWVSRLGHPYRFRQDCRRMQDGSFDEASAISIPLNGESVKRIEATTDHTRTGALVAIGTDASVFALRGNRVSDILSMSKISSYGLQSPRAMASFDGALAWMSNSGHITYFKAGEMQELSYRAMEDQVAPVTLTTYGERQSVVSMEFANGRLYVARRGATTSYQLQGDLVMVYDFRHGAWVGEDALPAEAPIHCLLRGEGGVKESVLYVVGRYGQKIKVYEYDSYGLTTDEQDAGTQNIAWALKTRDKIYGPDGMRVTLGRIGVFCSKLASGTMTLLRTYRPTGVTGTTTISLSATPSELHVIDDTPTSSDTTTEHWGAAANVKMSGTAPGGFQIFNAFVEVGARGDSHAAG